MICVEYDIVNENPIVYIYGRDKDGKRTIQKDTTFRPYFYVLKKDAELFKQERNVVSVEDTTVTDIEGREVSKITVTLPKYVTELRGKVEENFEADIQYPIRYTIDRFEEIPQCPMSVVYLDIETNSGASFPDVQTAQDEITAITCFNNLSKKCVTFVWRQDLNEETFDNGKCTFDLATGEKYEYHDYTIYFNDEREMLTKFLKYIQDTDPDIFTGWNVKDFDMRYIINRMSTLGINFQKLSPMGLALTNHWGDVVIKGRIIFDMLSAYRQMMYGELESFKLDNVSLKELGEKKVKFSGTHAQLWQGDLKTFIEYNKKDTLLVLRIQQKKKIIESFDEVRRMSKCAFNDVFNNSRVVDSFILSFCKDKYALPTKSSHKKEKYGGGKVLSPKKGMHEWISVYDFKALYPKIISSLNASPETLVSEKTTETVNLRIPYIDVKFFTKGTGKKKKVENAKYGRACDAFDKYFEDSWELEKQVFNGPVPAEIMSCLKYKDVFFKQNVKGFIPTILEHLFTERMKMQKERDKHEYGSSEYIRLEFRQYAFKVLMNSVYGVLGHHGFRLYRPEIAASITFIGRNSILWSKKILANNSFDTIYGDTDSVFVKSNIESGDRKKLINEESKKIQCLLQESYDNFSKIFNMDKHYLMIEFEKVYRRIFFGQAKKRYAGKLFWYKGKEADNINIVGFEVVRSDASNISRQTQKRVFEMLLKGEHKKDEVIDYVRSIVKDIKNDKYDYETIGFPTPLKKPLSDYKTNTPVVRGVIYSNRFLKLDIRPGEKFFLLYVQNIPNCPTTDVIAFRDNEDVPTGVVLNYQKHIEEATKDKMKSIFDGLGWSILELTGQKSIMDY